MSTAVKLSQAFAIMAGDIERLEEQVAALNKSAGKVAAMADFDIESAVRLAIKAQVPTAYEIARQVCVDEEAIAVRAANTLLASNASDGQVVSVEAIAEMVIARIEKPASTDEIVAQVMASIVPVAGPAGPAGPRGSKGLRGAKGAKGDPGEPAQE